jgi:ABC-type multidrug transport system fused ATPase/permease subunit
VGEGYTIYELMDAGRGRSRRELPKLIAGATRLMWAAGRRELLAVVALEALSAVGLAVTVLLGQDALAGILRADRDGGGWRGFLPEVIALAVVSAVLTVTQALIRHQDQLLSELTERHAQARILDVACEVELAAFDEPSFHDRVARAQIGAMRARQIVDGLLLLLGAVAGVVASVAALAALQPLLVPLALLAIAPTALLSRSVAIALYQFAYSMTPRDRERHYLTEVLTERDAAKEVRAMGLAGFLRARHDRLYEERIAGLRGVLRRYLRLTLLAGLGSSAVVGATLVLLVALALGGHMSLAAAAAAAGAMVLLGRRVSAGGTGTELLLESAMFIEDYLAFVELRPAPEEGSDGRRPARSAPGIVAAEDVWFAYPGTEAPTLRGLSLRIEPGEVVALVGPNGSGKTTLAKLLGGLYVPDRGRVFLHGSDTAQADRGTLRRDVAIVFQDFLRYQLPVHDNVALGRHERHADEAGVIAAARWAGVHDDLTGLRDGYRTQLGPAFYGGVDLSLGQWQKVALARLFFRDAPFVILDEPTAALDARAEHELFASIRELFQRRSVLLISHRFSTVRDADRIYVIEAGEIAESGSHDELMARGGIYAELFGLQASAYTN